MDLGLAGKRGVVVGGSRGIGKAIALELAREGVDLVISARTEDELARTAREISAATGRRVLPMPLDAKDRGRVESAIDDAARELGGLNILINSGSRPGGSPTATGRIDTIVDEDFLDDFDTKYMGALRCARAAIPHLKASGWGRIVNISGLNARTAGNMSGGARNASLVHLTRTLALQLGRDGITVNCIHPGATRTERTGVVLEARAKEAGLTPAQVEARDFAQDNPRSNSIGRMVDAAEIGYLTVFLCSEKAWAVNGEVIAADGGGSRSVYY
ncbi:MAG: SDR family oxidoreductase [Gammaproteobacteria bacterium]|nr:SDR family oxidoreductase [Gammaproteobacteria bacterium]